jgi:hypothetical protein
VSSVLTIHAVQRFAQRVDRHGDVGAALENAISVPRRYAIETWPELLGRGLGVRLRCSATAGFVCRGRRGRIAVTTIALDDDDLATLLTWLLTGCWVARSSPPSGDAP